jgi:serine/tyrosine/threonine adenylyltransferase
MDASPPIRFDNSYTQLPPRFYAEARPARASEPRLFAFNHALAEELGLDARYLEAHGAEIFSGNNPLPGAAMVAQVYAGHQFGHFVPRLGDGRAMLVGEVVDRKGNRRDIQLKGGGPTAWSRNGDGRAALGPVMREYIVSEAMHALGIPTTRALAAVTTGDTVYRETKLPGAVFTRVAASHIRVGTFQYFAARQDEEALRLLADHVIARHYPELEGGEDRYALMIEAVCRRQASLIAEWMRVGFIHGVMNTDNMAVSGETIDFGPCAFMDAFSFSKVFSSIDAHGRYAYANQPTIGQWNLVRFAEAVLPLLNADIDKAVERANEAIKVFGDSFNDRWLEVLRAKIGIVSPGEADFDLAQKLLKLMEDSRADFTRTFRALSASAVSTAADADFAAEFIDRDAAQAWLAEWRAHVDGDGIEPEDRATAMRRANPAFVPRNHRIEQAIVAAREDGDFSLFEALMRVLANPYDDQPDFARYAMPPMPDEEVARTFCGT